MPKTGLIIFLIVLGIQVLGSILAKAKKDQERKAREAAERARLEHSREATFGRGGESGTMAPAGNQPSQSPRPTTLAEARRRQIEQLRERRAARTTTTGTTVLRMPQPGPAGMNLPQAPSTMRPMPLPLPQPQRPATRPSPAPVQPKPQQRRPTPVPSKPAASRPDRAKHQEKLGSDIARRSAEMAHRHVGSIPEMPESHGPAESKSAVKAAAAATSRSTLRTRLTSRMALREAFILKELIDPPVSLREAS